MSRKPKTPNTIAGRRVARRLRFSAWREGLAHWLMRGVVGGGVVPADSVNIFGTESGSVALIAAPEMPLRLTLSVEGGGRTATTLLTPLQTREMGVALAQWLHGVRGRGLTRAQFYGDDPGSCVHGVSLEERCRACSPFVPTDLDVPQPEHIPARVESPLYEPAEQTLPREWENLTTEALLLLRLETIRRARQESDDISSLATWYAVRLIEDKLEARNVPRSLWPVPTKP